MSKILRSEHVDLEELRNQGVVGDILYNLVMEDGSLYQKPQDFPILPITSIDLDILKNLVDMQRLVIAIVSGTEKLKITYACLNGRYANVLICDDSLAEALLS
ncbi:MAG: sugar-binding domain-containing protein [Methanosarcinales archaeon]